MLVLYDTMKGSLAGRKPLTAGQIAELAGRAG